MHQSATIIILRSHTTSFDALEVHSGSHAHSGYPRGDESGTILKDGAASEIGRAHV